MMELWNYFKERKGFNRLLEGLKNKYVSLGRYSGNVVIDDLTEIEALELSNFFGVRLVVHQDFRTSFAKIEKRLKGTKYEDFTWEELFANYFGDHPVSRVDRKVLEKNEVSEFFGRVMEDLSAELRLFFSSSLNEKDEFYLILLKRYRRNRIEFEKDLKGVLGIVDHLESLVPCTLPLLASYTGNPHFLDMGTQNSNLFIKILARYNGVSCPSTTQDKINFLASKGIYVDNFSNYAITFLLRSNARFIEAFTEEKEPLNVNLYNLVKIGKLYTDCGFVFVFENPSMLTQVMGLNVPVIITSGNPNFVVYKLLDKLVESGVAIFYNGDFDPEGLLIANSLRRRYPCLELFCYDEIDYCNTISDNGLSEARLKKLDGVDVLELQCVKELILEKKRCGYQERNVERVLCFVESVKKEYDFN